MGSSSDWAQIERNVAAVVEAGEKAMRGALATLGIEATNTIKVLLTHPPVSLPGEPPGLRTGGLRLSYNWEVSRGRPGQAVLAVGSDAATRRPITGEAVNYAKYLEFGTRHMEARPHLRPAMAIITPLIAPTLVDACVAAERVAARGLRGITV